MKLQKVSINFSKFTDANFLNKAGHILTSMTGNPYFTDPVPPLGDVEDAVGTYRMALLAAEGLGRNNVAEKNKARKELSKILAQLGMYVMFVANGDAAILTSSGYTLTKMPEPRHLANPGNVTLSNGITSGQLVCSVKASTGATHFLHQIAITLPSESTVWTSTPSSRSRFVFSNLTPGKQYWVRVAAVASGEQIAYSNIATQFAQ